ncbi:MAG: hypothetical protein AB8B85_13075 [Paracoccaceae bacterium]
MTKSTETSQTTPQMLADTDLEGAHGGMLLPAVQSAREAARRPSEDKLGNFEIQDLMSRFNQAETLASSVQKKTDDTSNVVIGKV